MIRTALFCTERENMSIKIKNDDDQITSIGHNKKHPAERCVRSAAKGVVPHARKRKDLCTAVARSSKKVDNTALDVFWLAIR